MHDFKGSYVFHYSLDFRLCPVGPKQSGFGECDIFGDYRALLPCFQQGAQDFWFYCLLLFLFLNSSVFKVRFMVLIRIDSL